MDARTIAAISSPPGPGRRGILRLSGSEARAIAERALGPGRLPAGAVRGSLRASFDDGAGCQPALVLWMPGPRSSTGEDVVEFHLPGAPPLLARALARVLELGACPAAPGEFTRRAFENGRIDLTRAEGVLELVRATSDAARRSALQLLAGGLARRTSELRERLDEARALCEASLDFDELDTGHVPESELDLRLAEVEGGLAEARRAEEARQVPEARPRVVLAGAPNAGKSSLFNALVERGAALVSDHPGTTRDALVATLALGGETAALVDLPGDDPRAAGPDAEAQRRAAGERAAADLVLWVIDGVRLAREGEALRSEVPRDGRTLVVVSQIDRLESSARARLEAGLAAGTGEKPALAVSAVAGLGLDALRGAIAAALGRGESGPAGGLSREVFLRHRGALERAARAVAGARAELGRSPLDVTAERLREATAALDQIDGRTTPEDLLDRIFARFCLGK